MQSTTSTTPPIVLTIPPEAAGQPLLSYLRAQVDAALLEPIVVQRGVWHNRRRVWDMQQPAAAGDQVVLHRPPAGDGHYSTPLIQERDILAADDWLLALNKHPGWYTTPTPWDAFGNVRVALERWVQQRLGIMETMNTEASSYIHLAHQLDRDTSGVLLCTRHPEMNPLMQVAFETGAIEKEYLCLCVGQPPQRFESQTGHGRGQGGRWRLYPREEVGRTLANGSRVKVAHTSFVVERYFAGAALVRAFLHTGRTHQIRLHLAGMGHPLLGDVRYGGPTTFAARELPYHLLHAAVMRLEHPATGERLTLEARPSALMQALIEEIGA